MNIKGISDLYDKAFDVATDVIFGDGTLDIYIANRHSVCVQNINEDTACDIATHLLEKWDFSYSLEFGSGEEFYNYFK